MKVRSRTAGAAETRPSAPEGGRARPGDYFHSQRDLYRVESCGGERALIEDCRTGVLIDIEIRRLLELDPVRR
jgi:hypothetical protein